MAQRHDFSASLERHRLAVRARLRASGLVRPGPGSVSWAINRQVLAVAGWPRAILMQMAHPLVAAGVAEHSSFRGSMGSGFKRLSSTIDAMFALTFGSDEEAITAAARINSIHDRVSGDGYSAHDPDLLLWVHATLLQSIPMAYERFVGGLTPGQRDTYCADAAIMEPLLGIPAGLLPRNTAQLNAYLHVMCSSGRLRVNERSRRIAHAILFPPGWRLLWPAFRFVQLVTIGTLPPAVRAAYGFNWTSRDARALDRWTTAVRWLHRRLPRLVREWPVAPNRIVLKHA